MLNGIDITEKTLKAVSYSTWCDVVYDIVICAAKSTEIGAISDYRLHASVSDWRRVIYEHINVMSSA